MSDASHPVRVRLARCRSSAPRRRAGSPGTHSAKQEVLQAINVDGLMALIEAYEANEVYAEDICEPATADVEAAPTDTSEISPLLVPVK